MTPWTGASVPRPPPQLPASAPSGRSSPCAPPAWWPSSRGGRRRGLASQVCTRPRSTALVVSLAFEERVLCARAAAPGRCAGQLFCRALRGLGGTAPGCRPGPGQEEGLGWGCHSVPNTEPGGAAAAPGLEGRVHPASALAARSAKEPVAPPAPGSGGLGRGCGLWRCLGREPHYFKPLVPVQLPNPRVCRLPPRGPSTQAHTRRTHAPTLMASPGARPCRGQLFPVTEAGLLHLAS